MRKSLRHAALTTLKSCGVFHLAKNSEWRRQRLLILCYHGVSLKDEHEWRPYLYISAQQFERRLDILRAGKYNVLPLGEALERLFRNDLPPRSVALTFDDGPYDFCEQAYPRLRHYGFPATVYLTTYYSDLERPVFGLICSYMLWKARGLGTLDLREFGIERPIALGSAEARQDVVDQLLLWCESKEFSGEQKDEIAARLAECLQVDYKDLRARRILQLMNPREVKELAAAGVDFQLHTHRHRTPLTEEKFRREIWDNRIRLASAVAGARTHFCYPSGAYRPEFQAWLSADGIVSATTCDTGIAHRRSNPLLLPRLVDTTGRTDLEFESWVSGVGQFLSSGRRARFAYVPD